MNVTIKKKDSINIIKALGIIMMVYGHSGAPFRNFVYLYHMAIFFMCSGYCWNEKHAISVSAVTGYIKKKLQSLYIPFVVFNIGCCIFSKWFAELKLYDSNVNNSIFSDIVHVFFFREVGGAFCSATWFLRSLFFVCVTYCIAYFLLTLVSVFNRKMIYWIGIFDVIVAAELITHSVKIQSIGFATYFNSFPSAFLAFELGRILKKFENKMNQIYSYKGFLFALIILLILNQIGNIEMGSGKITNVLFFLICSFSGWVLLMTVANALRNSKCKNIFDYLGQHTMVILLLHFMAFKIVTFVYLLFVGEGMTRLSLFPVIEEGYLWIIYTIVGIVIPLVVNNGVLSLKRCFFKKETF